MLFYKSNLNFSIEEMARQNNALVYFKTYLNPEKVHDSCTFSTNESTLSIHDFIITKYHDKYLFAPEEDFLFIDDADGRKLSVSGQVSLIAGRSYYVYVVFRYMFLLV